MLKNKQFPRFRLQSALIFMRNLEIHIVVIKNTHFLDEWSQLKESLKRNYPPLISERPNHAVEVELEELSAFHSLII